MSQYGPTSMEQRPQPYAHQSQPQGQYHQPPPSSAPPEYNQQAYPPHHDHQAQGQYYNGPAYDQQTGQNLNPPQQQYQQTGANLSYYNGEQFSDPNDRNAPEGEKGLGSTVFGGAAGGFMGHKVGGGWGTAAGPALGAMGMNMATHKMKQQNTSPTQQYVAAPVAGNNGLGMGLLGRRGGLGIANRRLARRGLI
ncbi:hypothetical protein N7532_004129 [Penicillium argentinense]|uniref:Glycine zipper 2TM domain-containing protein n=1 Tax=Penicillium argentinense TaxID=1131581 RepID=A0A9W9FNT5_9EURO|nr:uncharacterized protein N7532_004129 [Penicillium argentinense]KAJ5103600.1 hypothetical protein N7532_004129 [Penicillium argentinense]